MKCKTLLRHLFAMLLALSSVQYLYAQPDWDTLPYRDYVDYRILNLDKSGISTGILYDRSFPVANVDRFRTQINTTDSSSPRHFVQAYYELYNAAYSTTGWLTPDQLDSRLDSNRSAQAIPIGLLHYNYNTVDSNAYVDDLVDTLTNGQFVDVQGRPRHPFLTHTTFIAAPLIADNATFQEGKAYTFYIDPQYFLYNQYLDIREIRIDFGDGQGEWVVSNPFSPGIRTTNFFNSITKVIGRTFLGRITIVAINLLGHWVQYGNPFTIFSEKEKPPTGLSPCNGLGRKWVINADPTALSVINNQYGNPQPQPVNVQVDRTGPGIFDYTASLAKDTAYFFFKDDGTCATKPVRRPVIFIDGFDPTNSRKVGEIFRDYINRPANRNGSPVGFGNYMLDNGNGLDDDFDFIVLDFKHGNDLIERNALTLVALIQQLNQTYGTSYQQDIVLIGPSMGSLVAQYALAYMEHNNLQHRVKTYISFDGCHQGANVPIGIQNFVEYISRRGVLKGIKTIREGLYNGLAARQMLAHHQSANSHFPAPDALRVQFLQNLAAVGEYPQLCRKVAILNGTNTGARNPKHSPNDELLGIEVRRAGLAGLCNGNICKKLKWKARSATDVGTNKAAEMWTASPLYNLLFWVPLGAKNYYADAAWGNSSHDDAPGGLFGEQFSDDMETHGTFLAKELLYLLTGDRAKINLNVNDFTLMPSYNAADLRFPSKNLYMKWDDQDLCGKTPFDHVYAPQENEPHVAISPNNSFWFENEARCAVGTLPVLISPILGNPVVCSTAVFSISPCKPIGAVQWEILPQGIASVTGTGTQVTVNRIGSATGSVTLQATINFCNSTRVITRQLQIGTTFIGHYFVSSNYSQPNQRPLGPNNAAIFLPAGQSFGVSAYITTPNMSAINWSRATSSYPFTWGANGASLYFSGNAGSGAYTQRSGTFTFTADAGCGLSSATFTWPVITQGWMRVSASPNPARDNLQVTITEEAAGKAASAPETVIMTLYNATSTVVARKWSFKAVQSVYHLNIQGIKTGQYLLVVQKGKYQQSQQVTIE